MGNDQTYAKTNEPGRGRGQDLKQKSFTFM